MNTINKPYFIVVSALTFVLPLISAAIAQDLSAPGLGKWFIFYAVGCRLFLAGIRQVTKPAFTAKEIFHINDPQSYPVVRELGFANLCFGIIGIVSLFVPFWRIVSAIASGLYYGLAGLQHGLKGSASINERFALVTDVFIFLALGAYVLL